MYECIVIMSDSLRKDHLGCYGNVGYKVVEVGKASRVPLGRAPSEEATAPSQIAYKWPSTELARWRNVSGGGETPGVERRLLEAAVEGMGNAHVLWGFAVGAAVRAEDGQVYRGCNVQSRISGLGVCAERCAVDHAILHGCRRIEMVAVVADAEHAERPRPCGACLQYIADFSGGEATVVTALVKDGKVLPGSVEVKTVAEMLPYRFEAREGEAFPAR